MGEETERPTDLPKVTSPGNDKAVSPGLQNEGQCSVHHPQPPTPPSACIPGRWWEPKGVKSKRQGSLATSESQRGLVKTQTTGPLPPRVSDSVHGMGGEALKICISSTFPEDAEANGLQPTL